MSRTFRTLIVLLLVMLGLGGRAFAADTSITVSGQETPGDSGNITISFGDSAGHSYSETVAYGQFSTQASIASAFGAKFSNDYFPSGLLCAHAVGSVIYFHLKGANTFRLPSLSYPSTSFSLATSAWQVAPTLSVATSGTPSLYGGLVTFTATISSGPAGTITFYDGGSAIGTGTIGGTTATFTTSTLGVGSHTITAGWPGSATYSSVTSSSIAQTVT